MAKSSAKNKSRRTPIITFAIILALGLPIVAGLFFKDYRDVPYGWVITIVWYVGFFAAFTLLLLYFALFVLPPHKNESWWEGITMIWRSITNNVPLPGRNNQGKSSKENIVPASFSVLRAGMLRSHQAVAIAKGNQYVRAAGPGFVRLRRGERIAQLFDLRPHLGIQKIDAITRDGITIKLNVFAKSQIHRAQEQAENTENLPYSYDARSILNACQLTSIDDNNKVTIWSEQITPQAAAYLDNAISQYNLNTLLENPKILSEANTRTQEILSQHLDNMGIEIMLIGCAILDYPPQVIEQRLENWRAPFQRDIRIRQAEGEARAIRLKKHARARAQIEIIQTIIQNIEEMRRAEQANLTEIVTLRMIEALENAMSNNTLQTLVPEQMLARLVMDTQGQMRELLPPLQNEGEEGML